jgi:hypothetical protein
MIGLTTRKNQFRRNSLRDRGKAVARTGRAGPVAQPDASAIGKGVHGAVDSHFRRCTARLALSQRRVRLAGDGCDVSLRTCAVCSPGAGACDRATDTPQPDGVRAIAHRDAGCLRAGTRSPGIAAFIHGFGKQKPEIAFALAGLAFGLATACKAASESGSMSSKFTSTRSCCPC